MGNKLILVQSCVLGQNWGVWIASSVWPSPFYFTKVCAWDPAVFEWMNHMLPRMERGSGPVDRRIDARHAWSASQMNYSSSSPFICYDLAWLLLRFFRSYFVANGTFLKTCKNANIQKQKLPRSPKHDARSSMVALVLSFDV